MNNAHLEIEYIKIDELREYERNTRRHRNYDVSQIAKSIEKYGFNDPIGIFGNDNTIVEGHGRLKAAISLGMEEVPCIRLDHMTSDERREYAIMHNKTAELSEWEYEMLAVELPELDLTDFDIDFNIGNIEETAVETVDFEDVEEPKENGYKICYEVVFSNEEEQAEFHKFLVALKNEFPTADTAAERLLLVVREWMCNNGY